MEEVTCHDGALQIFCYRILHGNHWVWMATILPTALGFFSHLSSLILDTILACSLVFNNQMFSSGTITFFLILVPSVLMLVFKPPKPPDTQDFSVFCSWIIQVLVGIIFFPLRVSFSWLNCLIWTVNSKSTKKPLHHNITEDSQHFTKETHTYLFFQAYLHCAPQAITQMYLLILGVAKDGFTVGLQIASVLVSVAIVASRTTIFHRYEAQVDGGRPALLFTRPPPSDSDNTKPLLPIKFCLNNRVDSLEMDCHMGRVVAFTSWCFLIFGRILCLVISYKTHRSVLIVFLLVHFSFMLLYLLSSQSITLCEVPSRLFNVIISIIALVEVSIRFYKIPLLYALFFICFVAEDTFLMILFFVYPSQLCNPTNLDCKYFGLCSYLIINCHVIGIILFVIYLARFRPRKKTMTTSQSAITIISI